MIALTMACVSFARASLLLLMAPARSPARMYMSVYVAYFFKKTRSDGQSFRL